MNAYILAGGKARRVSICKSFIKIGNKNLIDIVIEKLSLIFRDNIYIVIKEEQRESFRNYKNLVIEHAKESSSLLGIYTALSHTKEEWNFIIGTDMPGVNTELIREMSKYKEGYDIVVPFVNGYTEPLFAFYNRRVLPYVALKVKEGKLKIQKLFEKTKVLYIKEDIIKRFDPELISFININTWDDYKKAKERLLR